MSTELERQLRAGFGRLPKPTREASARARAAALDALGPHRRRSRTAEGDRIHHFAQQLRAASTGMWGDMPVMRRRALAQRCDGKREPDGAMSRPDM